MYSNAFRAICECVILTEWKSTLNQAVLGKRLLIACIQSKNGLMEYSRRLDGKGYMSITRDLADETLIAMFPLIYPDDNDMPE